MKLKAGDKIDQHFLVKEAKEDTTNNGKRYLSLDIKNRYFTGNTKLWNWEELESLFTDTPITAGSYVAISGVVNDYKGNLQIKTDVIAILFGEEIDYGDIFKTPNKPVTELHITNPV